jgi:hypothetical protein
VAMAVAGTGDAGDTAKGGGVRCEAEGAIRGGGRSGAGEGGVPGATRRGMNPHPRPLSRCAGEGRVPRGRGGDGRHGDREGDRGSWGNAPRARERADWGAGSRPGVRVTGGPAGADSPPAQVPTVPGEAACKEIRTYYSFRQCPDGSLEWRRRRRGGRSRGRRG